MRVLRLAIVIAALLSGSARAEGLGQSGINLAQTNKVVSAISNMFDACRDIAVVYRPDCLSRALQRGSGKISNNPGYWEAHVALTRASRAMTRLVRQYSDPNAARLRVQGYRLNAISEASMSAVQSAGEEVLARAQQDLERLAPYEREAFAPIATLLQRDRPWP